MQRFIVAAILTFTSLAALGQESPQADALWRALMDGNKLFVQGQVVYGNLPSLRSLWADGQNPPVSIVSCADSRVPAEIVFARTVGELFVVRVAGNVEDAFNIASLEYAVKHEWTKLIVVMGHSQCGAVDAAIVNPQPPPTPALGLLITRIRSSFKTERPEFRKAAVDNVCYTASQLRFWSAALAKVPIKMAYYDIETGVVTEITPAECGQPNRPTAVCGLTSPPPGN